MFRVIEIVLGIFMLVVAFWPRLTFYRGRLGGTVGKEGRTPVQSQWAARLLLLVVGVAAILDSLLDGFSR
jgi:hypothetical protein